MLGLRPRLGTRHPARIGAMTWSRRPRRAVIVRAASGGTSKDGRHGRSHPGPVQVDAADPGGPNLRGQGVEGAVRDEADVHAVQGGAEAVHHGSELGNDVRESLERVPDPECLGVVHDRLEAQHRTGAWPSCTRCCMPSGQPPGVVLGPVGQARPWTGPRRRAPGAPAWTGGVAGTSGGRFRPVTADVFAVFQPAFGDKRQYLRVARAEGEAAHNRSGRRPFEPAEVALKCRFRMMLSGGEADA